MALSYAMHRLIFCYTITSDLCCKHAHQRPSPPSNMETLGQMQFKWQRRTGRNVGKMMKWLEYNVHCMDVMFIEISVVINAKPIPAYCQSGMNRQKGLIGSNYFFAIMASKSFGKHINIMSILTPCWFLSFMVGQFFGPLADKITRKGELIELPASEKFSGLFLYMFWNINLKLGIYILSGNSDLLYSQNDWQKELYRAFRFGTHTNI